MPDNEKYDNETDAQFKARQELNKLKEGFKNLYGDVKEDLNPWSNPKWDTRQSPRYA